VQSLAIDFLPPRQLLVISHLMSSGGQTAAFNLLKQIDWVKLIKAQSSSFLMMEINKEVIPINLWPHRKKLVDI